MIPIGNVPLLERTLRWLLREGVRDVTVNLHHCPEQIRGAVERAGIPDLRVSYSLEDSLLGTAGGVKKCAAQFQDGTFVVVYGDNLIDIELGPLIEFHKSRNAMATIGLFSPADPSACGMVSTNECGRVRDFIEKPKTAVPGATFANAGVYLLEPSVLNEIPDKVRWDFAMDVFPRLIAGDAPVFAAPLHGYLQDTGTPDGYRQANWDVLQGRLGPVLSRVIGSPPDYCLVGADVELSADCELHQFNVLGQKVQLGSGAVLTNCILWDGAEVGQNVVLNNAILGSYAKVYESNHPIDGLVLADGVTQGTP